MKSENRDAELVFGEALRLSGSACAGNHALRQDVAAVLNAYANAADFLNQTLPLPAFDSLLEHAGTRIGRYKLLGQIGEGGFGVVWMAEQEESVRRRVALKIIKLGMAPGEVWPGFDSPRASRHVVLVENWPR